MAGAGKSQIFIRRYRDTSSFMVVSPYGTLRSKKQFGWKIQDSKKSPTGPNERTPKPEYLIARSQLTELGPLGFGPIQFLDG